MAELLQPPEGQINGGTNLMVASSENVGTKRQRRPSVRLGDIGDQQYDSHVIRRSKQWKLPMKESGKASKTRALMNLSGGGGGGDYHETPLDGEEREGNLDSVAIGSWKVKDSKSKRGLVPVTKRVRSSWVSKVDEGGGGGGDDKFSGGEDVDDDDDEGDDEDNDNDGFIRDFDPDGLESPLKEQISPIHSLNNNMGVDRGHGHGHRRGVRAARVSEGRGHHDDGVELSGPSDTEARRNWNGNSERDGVRVWLNQLGLGRYAPVFEIHEVDDEVLPMLTLEDLRDMGINAVGSRRKMYCAIQKLGKGFS